MFLHVDVTLISLWRADMDAMQIDSLVLSRQLMSRCERLERSGPCSLLAQSALATTAAVSLMSRLIA